VLRALPGRTNHGDVWRDQLALASDADAPHCTRRRAPKRQYSLMPCPRSASWDPRRWRGREHAHRPRLQLYVATLSVVYINAGTTAGMPFGGMKQSGNGHRELGRNAVEKFSEVKTLFVSYPSVE
jgi:hypothetical protein